MYYYIALIFFGVVVAFIFFQFMLPLESLRTIEAKHKKRNRSIFKRNDYK